jgi:hypothetical protein
MGVLSEIKRLVKQAQLIMPPVYKPEVYQQGAKNIANAVKKVPNAAWGVIGTGAGLAKGVADKVSGNDSGNSWGDYVRAGWNAGYNNGDVAAAGLIEGAAKSVPFANFEAPSRFADFVQNEKIENGMDPEVAENMRGRANWAGVGVAALPTMSGWGLLGKGMGATGRLAAPLMKANPARVGAMAEKLGPWAVVAGQEAPTVGRAAENVAKTVKNMYAEHNAQEAHRKMVESITPEKRQLYLNKSIDNFNDQSLRAAEGFGLSRDDFQKQFVDRNSSKLKVLTAPEAQRAALMKQYGFTQGDLDSFAGRFGAMNQIINAPEDQMAEIMKSHGMTPDELGMLYQVAQSALASK